MCGVVPAPPTHFFFTKKWVGGRSNLHGSYSVAKGTGFARPPSPFPKDGNPRGASSPWQEARRAEPFEVLPFAPQDSRLVDHYFTQYLVPFLFFGGENDEREQRYSECFRNAFQYAEAGIGAVMLNIPQV